MIPDFKTYIKESIWADLQDRSSGEVTRKEDDVNNLSLLRFYEYLTDIYKYTGVINYRIGYDDRNKYISVPLFMRGRDIFTFFIEGKNDTKIRTSLRFDKGTKKLCSKIEEVCNMEKSSIGYINITPKDGSPVTNNFILKVIDQTLNNTSGSLQNIIERI